MFEFETIEYRIQTLRTYAQEKSVCRVVSFSQRKSFAEKIFTQSELEYPLKLYMRYVKNLVKQFRKGLPIKIVALPFLSTI
jgi:hypothetical protein